MSDDAWRRTAEELVNQRDEWKRVADERAAEIARLTAYIADLAEMPRPRRIVLMLALRKRQARRDVRRARALGDRKAAPFLLTTYESTYCEASNAHELARRILLGTDP